MRRNTAFSGLAMPLLLSGAMLLGCSDDEDNNATTGSTNNATGADAGPRDAATGTQSDAGDDEDDEERLTEPQIVGVAAAVNAGEIQAATLAQSKGTSPEVRAYAQAMITMHTAAQQRQSALGVSPQPSPTRVKVEGAAATAQQILTVTPAGSLFDEAYIRSQVEMHAMTRDLIDDVLLPSATTPALRNELTQTRSEVEMHLEQARAISDGTTADAGTATGDAGVTTTTGDGTTTTGVGTTQGGTPSGGSIGAVGGTTGSAGSGL